jgi:hypothetical protein
MYSIKNILAAVGVIVLLLAAFKLMQVRHQKELDELRSELKDERIEKAELKKVTEGHYTKIVADNRTIEELECKVDSLRLKVKDPRIVEKIILRPRDEKHRIDEVVIKDSIIEITDYYPNKSNPFLKYYARLNTLNGKHVGQFIFDKIPISIVISKHKGLHKSDIIVPSFIEVESFDFESTSLDIPKVDNFGWLAGAGYFSNLRTKENGIEITAGLRYKRAYLLGTARTDSTVGLKTLIEFN